jgi:hypothetical protein
MIAALRNRESGEIDSEASIPGAWKDRQINSLKLVLWNLRMASLLRRDWLAHLLGDWASQQKRLRTHLFFS